jgi:hypothetical protein
MRIGEAGERFALEMASAPASVEVDPAIPDPEADFARSLQLGKSRMRVRSTGAGCVVYGPYCDLWPGRYQVGIEFLADRDNEQAALSSDGIVVVEVVAQNRLRLAELLISHGDFVAGTRCLDFVVPHEFSPGKDAARLEFRVRIEGQVHVVIGSIWTRGFLDECEAVGAAH